VEAAAARQAARLNGAARTIQDAWRRFKRKRIFRYYRDLIRFREAGKDAASAWQPWLARILFAPASSCLWQRQHCLPGMLQDNPNRHNRVCCRCITSKAAIACLPDIPASLYLAD
jgi:hypothetical protein